MTTTNTQPSNTINNSEESEAIDFSDLTDKELEEFLSPNTVNHKTFKTTLQIFWFSFKLKVRMGVFTLIGIITQFFNRKDK